MKFLLNSSLHQKEWKQERTTKENTNTTTTYDTLDKKTWWQHPIEERRRYLSVPQVCDSSILVNHPARNPTWFGIFSKRKWIHNRKKHSKITWPVTYYARGDWTVPNDYFHSLLNTEIDILKLPFFQLFIICYHNWQSSKLLHLRS